MMMVERIKTDVQYAVKVLHCCLFSRYLFLESKTANEWSPIGLRLDPYEGVALYPTFDLLDDPYYVCAGFSNGRHIPLPLVLGDDAEVGCLQRLALRLVRNSCALQDALTDCAYYEHQWWEEEEYAQSA